jgi:hypothetical protein
MYLKYCNISATTSLSSPQKKEHIAPFLFINLPETTIFGNGHISACVGNGNQIINLFVDDVGLLLGY